MANDRLRFKLDGIALAYLVAFVVVGLLLFMWLLPLILPEAVTLAIAGLATGVLGWLVFMVSRQSAASVPAVTTAATPPYRSPAPAPATSAPPAAAAPSPVRMVTPAAGAAPAAPVRMATPAPAAAPPAAVAPASVAATPVTAATAAPKALFDTPAGPADDLKLISGVGPVLEKNMNAIGITTFAQVARLTPEQTAAVEGHLGFAGRIARDNWLQQAEVLARGGAAEYERVFGKKPR